MRLNCCHIFKHHILLSCLLTYMTYTNYVWRFIFFKTRIQFEHSSLALAIITCKSNNMEYKCYFRDQILFLLRLYISLVSRSFYNLNDKAFLIKMIFLLRGVGGKERGGSVCATNLWQYNKFVICGHYLVEAEFIKCNYLHDLNTFKVVT